MSGHRQWLWDELRRDRQAARANVRAVGWRSTAPSALGVALGMLEISWRTHRLRALPLFARAPGLCCSSDGAL